ncbi:MAG: penicillin-binding protein activator, partial [Thermomonas sp.]
MDAVFAGEPPLPLLALNRGDRAPAPDSAAFSLSPEVEGVSRAQALVERGSRHVLLIVGGDEVQRRTAAAAQAQL